MRVCGSVMSNQMVQSLAVKYRPKKFEDLVGHETIVTQLRGMLSSGRITAALLFVGETGVGKTTLARMFASYLNGGDGNTNVDYEEMNMADSRKIDDIRALIQKAKNKPRFGKFRVFMLDEVHQLTGDSEKALLKSLEEPPPHTVWILATSEPEKVAPEVIGRCSIFKLLPPDKISIAKRLRRICKYEKIDLEKKLLLKIAELSSGRVRNAISLLESCFFYKHDKPDSSSEEILNEVVKSSLTSFDSETEKLAVKCLIGCYTKNKAMITKALTIVREDYIQLVNVMLSINQYVVDNTLAPYSPGLWHTAQNKRFLRTMKELNLELPEVKEACEIQNVLIELRQNLQTLSVPGRYQLSAAMLKLC